MTPPSDTLTTLNKSSISRPLGIKPSQWPSLKSNDLNESPRSRISRNDLFSDTGATLVETAIFLPLLLIFFFFMIWLGVTSNTAGNFKNSIGHALLLAASRGDLDLMRQNTIQGFSAWMPGTPPPPPMVPLLAWDGDNVPAWGAPTASGHASPSATYQSLTLANALMNGSPIASLSNMPDQYIYTLIYIYQHLRQSIGNSIHYPCGDIAASPGHELDGPSYSGCLYCEFIDPAGSGGSFNVVTPVTEIAITCHFRPDEIVLRPLTGIIDIVARLSGANSSYKLITLSTTKQIEFSTGLIP